MATEKTCQEFLADYFKRNPQVLASVYYKSDSRTLAAMQPDLEDESKWFMEDSQDLRTGFPSQYLEGPYMMLPDGVKLKHNCEPVQVVLRPQEEFSMEHFMINEELDFGFLVVQDEQGMLHLANFMGG